MPESKSEIVAKFFDLCCDLSPNGEGWECSAWSSKENQWRLFQAATLIGDLTEGTVLDVGCGHADLYTYLDRLDGGLNYTGIDISKKMLQRARRKHPDLDLRSLDLKDLEETFDWVIAVGPFNIQVSVHQVDYLKEQIRKMYSLARRGLAFTCISSRAVAPEHRFEQIFYYDPAEIFDFCLSLSQYVAVDHMAEPTQMVVYMPKIDSSATT